MIAIGEHYRSNGASAPPGVYRVVGVPDEVTLLRVADEDGRRQYTGVIVSVPVAAIESDFEPANDPDAGFAPVTSLRNAFQGLYWSVRRFV